MDILKILYSKRDNKTTQITKKMFILLLTDCKNIINYYIQFLDLNIKLIKTDPIDILLNL
jgi:hypothetical protein